jgi:hypothetical protein
LEVDGMKKRTALALGLLSAVSVFAIRGLKKKEPRRPGEPLKPGELLRPDRFLWKREERPLPRRRPPGEPLPPPQARLDEL